MDRNKIIEEALKYAQENKSFRHNEGMESLFFHIVSLTNGVEIYMEDMNHYTRWFENYAANNKDEKAKTLDEYLYLVSDLDMTKRAMIEIILTKVIEINEDIKPYHKEPQLVNNSNSNDSINIAQAIGKILLFIPNGVIGSFEENGFVHEVIKNNNDQYVERVYKDMSNGEYILAHCKDIATPNQILQAINNIKVVGSWQFNHQKEQKN